MYCFHSVEKFSKFGSYTGTGGNLIVETGFEPALLMIKRTDAANYDWYILDNKRNPIDYRNTILRANSTDADVTVTNGDIDVKFLSNGFAFDDIPTTSGGFNASGGTYIYMAFAADPDTEAPTVAKSFSTVAYTGTQATLSIDSLGFKAGLIWLKNRDITGYNHFFYDIVRGSGKAINTNLTAAEYSLTGVSSFDDDGFTLGSNYETNRSGDNHIAWVWKADDNEPTINTEGSIDSLVSANANAGFSIVKYEGTGSNATIGHGLSAAPEMMIIKNLDQADGWVVYHSAVGTGQFLSLNATDAASGSGDIFGTPNDTGVAPTSTVFTVGSNHKSGANGENYIAYCFHSVAGYSKFGSYTGNGSGSGQTITTGFQPDWIILKCTSVASKWMGYSR